ncbi:hypothetical protein ACFVVO_38305, partial [Streptomyces sp. NPDC058145]
MDFDLAPPSGVGPLRIGMSRQSANTALDSLRDLSAVSESDQPGQHVFRPSGLMISIHCTRDMLEAVELGRPSTQTDRVVFRGLEVFAIPARVQAGHGLPVSQRAKDLTQLMVSELVTNARKYAPKLVHISPRPRPPNASRTGAQVLSVLRFWSNFCGPVTLSTDGGVGTRVDNAGHGRSQS